MKTYDVGVIGLGYVGLTLATALAEAGLKVVGVEKREDVVNLTNSGKPHFSENGLEEALSRVVRSGNLVALTSFDPDTRCDTYIITVGTPLNIDGQIQLSMIESAAQQVSENIPEGALVILRSTVKIGTARNIVAPILAISGKRFDIAVCPERTLEGRAMTELRELPQIVGADSKPVRNRAAMIFRRLTNVIVYMDSLEGAEIVKLADNTFRDVQFGFANEVARLCDAVGVNGYEVINQGKVGYSRTNIALPGLVGGPCLEKDPHIFLQSARDHGLELEITMASRIVNERQPQETVEFVSQLLDSRGFEADAPIALLGMAFKGVPETDDLRGSMSLKVLNCLQKLRPLAKIRLFDPVVLNKALQKVTKDCTICGTLDKAIEGAASILIVNNHPIFGKTNPINLQSKMVKNGFIYDYWNHFSARSSAELGQNYFAVGNSNGGIK